MGEALLRLIIYVGIIAVPVVVASILAPSSKNVVHEVGKCFALAGFTILALQVFLRFTSRRKGPGVPCGGGLA